MYTTALIGCGRISHKHIEGFVHNADALRLVSVCDPVQGRAQEKQKEYQKHFPEAAVGVYADYREMLAARKPDIVTIAAESGRHCEIAIDCFRAGSHVICEKPMALSTADADRMIAAANKNNRAFAVCFQNRFNAPVQKMRAALEQGRFGRILHGMIQIRWNRNDTYYAEAPWRGTWELDGGTLMNQCTHGIDLLQWMLGEDAVRVQGMTRRFMRPIEAEDFGAAIVEFRNGAVGIIEGSADIFPRNLSETLSVFGETGSAVIGGLAVNELETWRFADAEEELLHPEGMQPAETPPPTVYGFGHAALFRDFAEAIRLGRKPLISGEDGRKALEIVLAIYKAQKTGVPVELPCGFSSLEMKGYFDSFTA